MPILPIAGVPFPAARTVGYFLDEASPAELAELRRCGYGPFSGRSSRGSAPGAVGHPQSPVGSSALQTANGGARGSIPEETRVSIRRVTEAHGR